MVLQFKFKCVMIITFTEVTIIFCPIPHVIWVIHDLFHALHVIKRQREIKEVEIVDVNTNYSSKNDNSVCFLIWLNGIKFCDHSLLVGSNGHSTIVSSQRWWRCIIFFFENHVLCWLASQIFGFKKMLLVEIVPKVHPLK